MEFVNGGELYHRLTTDGKMKEPEAKQAFAQILSAVKHIVRPISIIYNQIDFYVMMFELLIMVFKIIKLSMHIYYIKIYCTVLYYSAIQNP